MTTFDGLGSVIAGLPDPALLLDRELRVVKHNRAFLSFAEIGMKSLNRAFETHASPFEVVGQPSHAEVARECLRSKHPVQMNDVEVIAPDGSKRTAIVAFIPLVDEREEAQGLLYLVRDVSSDIRLQRRYQNLVKQLQARLTVLEGKEKIIAGDLEEARAFQRSILAPLPASERARFAAVYLPADAVGGDFYEVVQLDERTFRVLVADATGHGVQAALRTMILKNEYAKVARSAADPGVLLTELNRHLCERYRAGHVGFASMCFDLVLDGASSALRYANAGAPPLIQVTGRRVIEIHRPGLPIGTVIESIYESKTYSLAAGDRVFACTDGLFDADTAEGDRFGEERAHEILGGSPEDLYGALKALTDAWESFLAGRAPNDDVTMIAIEVLTC